MLALILPIYKLYAIILTAAIAAAAFIFLTAKRRQQLAKLPPAPPVKVRAEEMSKKIDLCRETLLNQQKQIKNTAVSSSVGSIAGTMDLIADELE